MIERVKHRPSPLIAQRTADAFGIAGPDLFCVIEANSEKLENTPLQVPLTQRAVAKVLDILHVSTQCATAAQPAQQSPTDPACPRGCLRTRRVRFLAETSVALNRTTAPK